MKCGYLLFISARNLERRLLLSWQENIKWNSCSTSLNWQKGQIRRLSGILGIVCLPVSIDNWWFLSQYLFKGNLHYFNKYLLKCLKCTYYKIWKKNVSANELMFYSQFRTDCHKADHLNAINNSLHKKPLKGTSTILTSIA